MLWILLWTALLLGALVFWAFLGRRLWRQTKALGREVTAVTAQLDTLSTALGELDQAGSPAQGASPVPAARTALLDPPDWDVRRHGRRARTR